MSIPASKAGGSMHSSPNMADELAPTPGRSRRRRRWIVAAALLLTTAYPASEGPVQYAVARGWISAPTGMLLGRPAGVIAELASLERPRRSYLRWWEDLGRRHVPEVFTLTLTVGEVGSIESVLTDGNGWSRSTASGGRVTPSSVYTSHVLRGGELLVISDGRALLDGNELAVLPPVWTKLEVRRSSGGRFMVSVE